jgi:glutathione S-transferase
VTCELVRVRSAFWAGVEIEDFPLLNEWCERIELRDGVKAGLKVPVQDSKTIHRLNPPTEEELERQAKEASAWVLKGVEADKKQHNKD